MTLKLPMRINVTPNNYDEKIHYTQALLNSLPDDQDLEIIISKTKKKRSLEQLGALFGAWFKYLSQETGYEINYLHRWMKEEHLSHLYKEDPQTPEQELWSELFYVYQEAGDQERLAHHKQRISLSWIRHAKQMAEYMSRIDQYWADQGITLPELDELYKLRKSNEL